MLTITNNIGFLEPFFKDSYKRINIREYARIRRISPPFASKILSSFKNENILIKETEKNYIYYTANKESKEFIELSRLYWYFVFKKIGILEYLEREMINPVVILFGSFSKAEIKQNSDIDIAIFTISKKVVNLEKFEKKLNRKIQLFVLKSREDLKNNSLLNNILNGFILSGEW